MGHFEKKINDFAGALYQKYCVGNPKFVNKKAIRDELTKLVYEYLINNYINKSVDEKFYTVIIAAPNIIELATQMQYPLLVVKNGYVGQQYNLDLCINNSDIKLVDDLRFFFTTFNKMIERNCQRIACKKMNKQKHNDVYIEYDGDDELDIEEELDADALLLKYFAENIIINI